MITLNPKINLIAHSINPGLWESLNSPETFEARVRVITELQDINPKELKLFLATAKIMGYNTTLPNSFHSLPATLTNPGLQSKHADEAIPVIQILDIQDFLTQLTWASYHQDFKRVNTLETTLLNADVKIKITNFLDQNDSPKNPFGDPKILTDLEKHWSPKGEIELLMAECKDFPLAVLCYTLLHTATVEDAWHLCFTLFYFFIDKTSKISDDLKKKIADHIETLQNQEKRLIWHLAFHSPWRKPIIEYLLDLGCNPNWTDHSSRTVIFYYSLKSFNPKTIARFDFHHLDFRGSNALEQHCKMGYSSNLEFFTQQGLSLGDNFPNVQLCREIFPDSPFLQAILGTLLIYQHKSLTAEIFFELKKNPSIYPKMWEALENDKIQAILGKFSPSFNGVQRPSLPYWEIPPPEKAANYIPCSPRASLLIHQLITQHQSLPSGAKPMSLRTLFKPLRPNDMAHFSKYLVDDPSRMSIIVQDYFGLKRVNFQYGGCTKGRYGKAAHAWLDRMPTLGHLQTNQTTQKVHNAFKTHDVPTPIETVEIDPTAQVQKLGRTAVITHKGETHCLALKFLKQRESFVRFAQEKSVTEAFRDLGLSSRLIKPIGIYAIEDLPSALSEFKQQPTGYPEIALLYTSHQDTFTYLQDVSPIQYPTARRICLADAAKMVRMEIYPDLAAMFHNAVEDRRYVLLVDLATLLRLDMRDRFNPPAGGAGRLDQFDASTRYPNMRASGLTDLRDASGIVEERKAKDMGELTRESHPYFFQMNALADILLVDMLILSKRHQDLKWNDSQAMDQFGNDLAQGFACVAATYSNESEERWLNFAENCGINWARAARQIAFWQDISPSGYPNWVAREAVPPDLYEKGVKIQIDGSLAKNFDPVNGFSTNGHRDMGPYNGPLALTEFEKAMHLLVLPIAVAELDLNKTQ